MIPGGKEEDKARQAVFLTPVNLCGKDPLEEKPHSDYTVPQKAPYETKWKRNQERQKQSFAIMTYFTVPGDCIDRVTAQDGDRVLFERLATPRPAPKVTLKRIWKQRATWERKAEVQDDSKHIAEADQATRKPEAIHFSN